MNAWRIVALKPVHGEMPIFDRLRYSSNKLVGYGSLNVVSTCDLACRGKETLTGQYEEMKRENSHGHE